MREVCKQPGWPEDQQLRGEGGTTGPADLSCSSKRSVVVRIAAGKSENMRLRREWLTSPPRPCCRGCATTIGEGGHTRL